MSPNVGNFVHDLVEMAKAMETLPQVQAELAHSDAMRNAQAEVIASREKHIIELKAEIMTLHSRIHEAEVAKDAAETMFLEADDRTSRALDFIKATFGNAGSLIQALDSAKPVAGVPVQAMPKAAEVTQPKADPIAASYGDGISQNPAEPAETSTTAISSPIPTPPAEHEGIPSWATPEIDHIGDYIPKAINNPMYGDSQPPQGQSESPLPDASSTTSQSAFAPSIAASAADAKVKPIEEPQPPSIDPGSAISETKPWAGMKWSDAKANGLHPPASHSTWLDGGGLSSDYYS